MRSNASRILAIASLATVSFLMSRSQAATTQYFDTNGTSTTPNAYGITTGSTYSWESPYWTATSGGAAATSTYIADGTGFPRFYGGVSGDAYTVTVGIVEPTVGMYAYASGVSLTIAQAPSTSGGIGINPTGGSAVVLPDSTSAAAVTTTATFNGFLVRSTSLTISAPISGTGGVQQSSAGALSLLGNNTFSGGFASTGGQTTNYNNSNSFGTGSIIFTGATAQGIVNTSGTAVTIANPLNFAYASTTSAATPPVTTLTAGTITNFVSGGTLAAPGTTFTGTGRLAAAFGTTLQVSQATGSSFTKFTGAISGAGSLNINATSGGIILAGANTYTGSTTVTAGILALGANNTIASSSSAILAGGTLNTGGSSQITVTPGSGVPTLGLTASSVMDFTAGISVMDFANSSALAWGTNTLNLLGYTTGDLLNFGPGGLTASQLADIEFGDASTKGTAQMDALGNVTMTTTPEPAAIGLLALGGVSVLRRRRSA